MSQVAIVGCGQLARMLALAGWRMGIHFSFIACDNEETYCVDGLGPIVNWSSDTSSPQHILGPHLYQLLGSPDVITVERESVCVDLLESLAACCAVAPNPEAVFACQHRFREKNLLGELGVASADYRYACNNRSIALAVSELGYPLVLKAASDGYDGKQQWRFQSDEDYQLFQALDTPDRDWIVERCIPFDYEVSFFGARAVNGEIRCYPATKNLHRNGILQHSSAPAQGLSSELQQRGLKNLAALMQHLDYVGILAMECFVAGDQLLVNELAPRVHNSGHWTQQGGLACQFENHLRAVLGLPLGSTVLQNYSGMVNILGHQHGLISLDKISSKATVHQYNKPHALGRKLGHIGVSAESPLELEAQLCALQALVGDTQPGA